MNGGEREITVETNSSVDRPLASLGARRSVPFKEVGCALSSSCASRRRFLPWQEWKCSPATGERGEMMG
jgi:hypothetical protein